jgi:signal transduction histidine kinase
MLLNDAQAAESLRLISAAAHELKTPLTVIAHLASSIGDPEFELSIDERRQTAQRIQYTAERTLRLVQDLTLSYRLGQSDQLTFALELEPVNLMQVCEEAAHELVPYAKSRTQTIFIRPLHKQHLVVAHRRLLHSVLFNLIDNAIRHNPPETHVNLSAQKKFGNVRLHVRDDGPGISPKVFSRFASQLGKQAQPLTGRAGNSGLGLYVAGQLAVAMGGQLSLGRSAEGADFRVDLLRSQQLSFL